MPVIGNRRPFSGSPQSRSATRLGAFLLLRLARKQTRERPNRHHRAEHYKRQGSNERRSFKVAVVAFGLGRLDQREERTDNQGAAKGKGEQRQ